MIQSIKTQKNGMNLDNKVDAIYIPLLNAFKDEILRQNSHHKKLPRLLVEYLLGKFDFYKVISLDKEKITRLQCFNLRGTLNKIRKIKKKFSKAQDC